ncbi:MAG: SusD/RagB family nutrient-binding outer membrane lipoprotein [Bacteroidia bacterium]|nr:MAG: SusD/RagB family nutrient-binding outer membrane lipoprotein [Bacteroidia bacterium]
MKKIIFIISVVLALFFSGCTENFEELNTNPYQISGESLEQDFNHVGAYFKTLWSGDWFVAIIGHQTMHNLCNTSWVRQLGCPTPFVGGINNTTYYMRWSPYWGRIYGSVMAPARQVKLVAEEGGYDVFAQWATLVMVSGAHRLSAYCGPIIYTDYGTANKDVMYDSEETLYDTWFAELDEIVSVFGANLDYAGLSKFDEVYAGDMSMWLKYANSLRLRLAMRIVNVDPALAQAEAQKAMNNPGGLIMTNADNTMLSLQGNIFGPAVCCFAWDDTRMSASMESILIGYEDNRIASYFEPVSDLSLVTDHPTWPYKGVRVGAEIVAKSDHTPFSTINKDFNDAGIVTKRALYTAQETHFLLAEAALRGWTGSALTLTAQGHYEEGIKMSFEEWGAGGADAYILNNAGIPLDYDDPVMAGDVNDFVNRIQVTVAWDDAATNEVKLERIMTQKWIAAQHNSIEAWVDHRRTGYPKLPYNYRNDSSPDHGVIADDDFLKRVPIFFGNSEQVNNPVGYADAVTKLGGPDLISTRLWWDTGGSNF